MEAAGTSEDCVGCSGGAGNRSGDAGDAVHGDGQAGSSELGFESNMTDHLAHTERLVGDTYCRILLGGMCHGSKPFVTV